MEQQLIEIVKTAIKKTSSSNEEIVLDKDSNLADSGLNSLGMVTLVGDINKGLGIRLPAKAINKNTFESVETILEALNKYSK